MKTIRCLVVDDEPMAREILENLLSRIEDIEVVGSCKSSLEAFEIISDNEIDLLFLDINMPGISGLSFAKSINKNIKIIFATAYREYAVEGFDLQAVDYLLKPISYERLQQAISKYRNEDLSFVQTADTKIALEKCNYFFVRADRKMVRISFEEILYVESFSDYVKIHLKDKTVVTRETITSIEAKLPQHDFLRIHRSFIVALTHTQSYTNEYIEVNNMQISISRTHKKEVLERLRNL